MRVCIGMKCTRDAWYIRVGMACGRRRRCKDILCINIDSAAGRSAAGERTGLSADGGMCGSSSQKI